MWAAGEQECRQAGTSRRGGDVAVRYNASRSFTHLECSLVEAMLRKGIVAQLLLLPHRSLPPQYRRTIGYAVDVLFFASKVCCCCCADRPAQVLEQTNGTTHASDHHS
jgi:hypothetical protein